MRLGAETETGERQSSMKVLTEGSNVKTSRIRQFVGCGMLMCLAFQLGWAAALRAGVAKVEITPPPGVQMWGYSNRKGPASGTLDALYARVLVLEAGDKRLALVTVDLGRPFGPASLEWLRKATRNDASCLIVAATHTHSGPVIADYYAQGRPEWETSAARS